MTFIKFDTQSPYYQDMLALRHLVLRKPLGLNLYQQDLANEVNYWHFGVLQNGRLVACVMIVPQNNTQVTLKQMAVSPDAQGNGLGQKLIRHVERDLISNGISLIELAARDTAIGFYQQLGYRCIGEPFVDVTLTHQLMTKILTSD